MNIQPQKSISLIKTTFSVFKASHATVGALVIIGYSTPEAGLRDIVESMQSTWGLEFLRCALGLSVCVTLNMFLDLTELPVFISKTQSHFTGLF